MRLACRMHAHVTELMAAGPACAHYSELRRLCLLCWQVAGQEGHYLAGLLKSGAIQPDKPLPSDVQPFKYKLGNSVAYIGGPASPLSP